MTYAIILEKWEGKTILNLRSVVDAIYDAYVPIAATDDRNERIARGKSNNFGSDLEKPREDNRGQG
jgi:hypothetical protein